MCRSRVEGGQRCTGGHSCSREGQAARQRACRARKSEAAKGGTESLAATPVASPLTRRQAGALSAVCREFGVDFGGLRFDRREDGGVGAFIGLAYAECTPAGDVSLWCDCGDNVPYGTCVICPTCDRHAADCRESRCRECGRCETACIAAGCPGY